MLKATLIALAATTAVDAVATGGQYRMEFIGACIRGIANLAAMGWSMTLT